MTAVIIIDKIKSTYLKLLKALTKGKLNKAERLRNKLIQLELLEKQNQCRP